MKKLVLMTAAAIFMMVQMNAQDEPVMQIGETAPSFKAESTNGKISFPSDFGKSWKILFSHPKDFTPVCSSEILELAYEQEAFKKMDVKLIVMSTDILEQHKSWKASLEELKYEGRTPVKIDFPIVADNDLKVSKKYGMIHSKASTTHNIRGVYFIDPDNTIRAIYYYPNEVGRNVDELKRTLLALQATDANEGLVSPANWRPGKDMMVPVLSNVESQSLDQPGSDYYSVAWFMNFKKLD